MKKKINNKTNNNRFPIDFYEFSFLVEACIPPVPIARAMFWDNVIDKYYYVLTEEERDKLFEWINRHPSMQSGLQNKNEKCLLFNARYDKNNQYNITTNYENKIEIHKCFMYNNKHHTSITVSISEDYITEVNKTGNINNYVL